MRADRVLVTGAGGFIGSHLTAELARRGQDVAALDLHLDTLRAQAPSGRVELVEGDVADPAAQERALRGVGTVFHLAAAHLGAAVPEREFWRVNVEAVRTLTDGALAAGVRRFVHCSSVGVYGRIERPPADEETSCHPDLPYERTKLAGEQVVAEKVRTAGLPAVILRPVWVYGPGCPRTEKLFRAIARGRFLVAGRGRALRHSIYIRDMVEAFLRAAEAEEALGRVIVVGDARPVTVRELVDAVARTTGARRPRSVPLPLFYLAAIAAELVFRPLGKEPPVSRRSLRFFTANTAFDTGRARRLLNFEPRYDLPQGLAETFRGLEEAGVCKVMSDGLPAG